MPVGSNALAPNQLWEAAVFNYRMIWEDGSPADPPLFTTAVPTWHVGDEVLIRPGFEFEIVAIDQSVGDAHAVWTVRRR